MSTLGFYTEAGEQTNVSAAVAAAEAAAAQSQDSADDSAQSAVDASNSADTTQGIADASQASADAAASSAADSANFANTSSGSATDASASASTAANSAIAAAGSASNASVSAGEANTSAGEAATSETNAATSEANAAQSAIDAAATISSSLQKNANLSDLTNDATARSNLDVYSTTESDANYYGKSEVYTKTESNANYYATGSKVSDSNLLDSLDSTYFRNAGNLNAGTVADARLPSAATNDKGIVQLSTSVSSTSTTLAATPSAVRIAYNAAISATTSTSFGAVGTYIIGRNATDIIAGNTISGIGAAGFYTASGSGNLQYSSYASISGTWRAMGTVSDADPGGNIGYTLYVRIA